MSESLYQLYKDSVYELAMTCVVKHSEVADAMNYSLINKLYNDTAYAVGPDPATWKYYMNLAGQYHMADMDALVALNGLNVTYVPAALFIAVNAPLTGASTHLFDGRTLVDQQRVFLANQIDPTKNGFYLAEVDYAYGTYVLRQLTLGGVIKNNTAFLVYYGDTYGNSVVTFTTPTEDQTPFGTTGMALTKQPNGILVPVAIIGGTYALRTMTVDLIYGSGGDVAIYNTYRFDSVKYNALVAQYPGFEELIQSILHPVPTAVSTTAENGDILYAGGYYRTLITQYERNSDGTLQLDYNSLPIEIDTVPQFVKNLPFGLLDEKLVEDNEDNLLPEMQRWIKATLWRWHNASFTDIDDLYMAAMLGVLYSNLVPQIVNIRLANCLTIRAHSYHVRAHLDSLGGIGKYIQYIPKPITMWLYRNAARLRNQIGTQATFDELVSNLLSPAGIPLSRYTLRHSLTELASNIGGSETNLKALYPAAFAERDVINFEQAGAGGDTVTITELLNKEIALAPGNSFQLEDIAGEINTAVATSRTNRLPTKVAESVMIDLSDHTPWQLADVLLHYWIFCASNGTYTADIYVTHPVSGEILLLSPLSAVILMFYAMNQAKAGLALETIPTITAHNIPRSPTTAPAGLSVKPTLSQLKYFVNSKYLDDSVLTALLGVMYDPVNLVLDTNYTHNSAALFYKGGVLTHAQIVNRWLMVAGTEDAIGRAMADQAFTACYWPTVNCQLAAPGTTYASWLASIGFDTTGISQDNYLTLANDIITQATGNTEANPNYLVDLQAAVLAIMKTFSSYSIQYTSSISASAEKVCDLKRLRVTNVRRTLRPNAHIEMGSLTALSATKTRPTSTPIRIRLGITPRLLG